ncbi:unnamed protein product [Sympodiomycopsis kandeliae]
MPREGGAVTSVINASANLPASSLSPTASSYRPFTASQASRRNNTRDADLGEENTKGSVASREDGGQSKSKRSHNASRREQSHPSRGGKVSSQASTTKPPFGAEGSVTLIKRSATTSEDHIFPGQKASTECNRHGTSQVATSAGGVASSKGQAARTSDEIAAPARPGGIISLPPEARTNLSAGPEQSTHPRSSSKTPNRTSERVPRSQDQKRDFDSHRSRGGPSKIRTADHDRDRDHRRRQPRHLRDSPEAFDRGTERSADGSHQGHQQLFDPRRHNALSFSKNVAHSTGSASISDARTASIAGSAAHSAPSVTSSEGRERRKRRGGAPSDVSSSSRPKDESKGGDGAMKAQSSEASGYVIQLKKAYHDIQVLEAKLKEEHQGFSDRDSAECSRGTGCSSTGNGRTRDGAIDHEFWLRLTSDHKRLADLHSAFFELALRPGLPTSHHSLPQDYNLPIRLWQTAFHLLLDRLRHSLPYSSALPPDGHVVEAEKRIQVGIMDHLTDFIYYAYGFYTTLLEDETFQRFRSVWLENLGDLARYRVAVASLNASLGLAAGGVRNKIARSNQSSRTGSPSKFARIDDEDDESASQTGAKQVDAASIGSAALGDWEFEDRETWSTTAKGWYAKGLADTPGTGRLHHHLALLSDRDQLRALYHFCKALTTLQPFPAARESVLSLFGQKDQQSRLRHDASLEDLFVHLHGMLFTRVQLDDFEHVSSRFLKLLQNAVTATDRLESLAPSVLMMMGVINISSLMQYGADGAILHGSASVKHTWDDTASPDSSSIGQAMESKSDLDPTDGSSDSFANFPVPLRHAIKLTFESLRILLPQPGTTNGSVPVPDPYVTVVMAFLFRLARSSSSATIPNDVPPQLKPLVRAVPWQALARLPLVQPGMTRSPNVQKIGAAKPLPEDWCLRGLTWTGRRLFEREFFKVQNNEGDSGASPWSSAVPVVESEVDVLNTSDRSEDGSPGQNGLQTSDLRWRRIGLVLSALIDVVPGFNEGGVIGLNLDEGNTLGEILIADPLSTRLAEYAEQQRLSDVIAKTCNLKLAKDSEVSSSDEADQLTDDDMDDLETDSTELRHLKARIRELRVVLGKKAATSSSVRSVAKPPKRNLNAVPGYTTLVLDTNIILHDKASFLQKVVESHRWAVIVPLAAITELEGLRHNATSLGEDAVLALSYLEVAVKTHSTWLKIQTSKGNYLSDLSFRHEDLDMSSEKGTSLTQPDAEAETSLGLHSLPQQTKTAKARSLDEVILRCLLWQRDHWTDRRNIILGTRSSGEHNRSSSGVVTSEAPKVVMITLDRGLRLRVMSKGCPAAGNHDLAEILDSSHATVVD